jgi:hypothetical protein
MYWALGKRQEARVPSPRPHPAGAISPGPVALPTPRGWHHLPLQPAGKKNVLFIRCFSASDVRVAVLLGISLHPSRSLLLLRYAQLTQPRPYTPRILPCVPLLPLLAKAF